MAKAVPSPKGQRLRQPYKLPKHIGYLIHETSRIRSAVFDKALRPIGITRAQWWLLATLSNLPEEGVSQQRLASAMRANKVTVGVMLNLLEGNGLIEREIDVRDQRARVIKLTDKGYYVLDQSKAIARYVNGAILASIPEADIKAVEDTLEAILVNLHNLNKTE